jgi:hypothetical protein
MVQFFNLLSKNSSTDEFLSLRLCKDMLSLRPERQRDVVSKMLPSCLLSQGETMHRKTFQQKACKQRNSLISTKFQNGGVVILFYPGTTLF